MDTENNKIENDDKLATEKFEQYKYELECDTYLEKNNISKDIKNIIKFDSLETLEKNIITLQETFGQTMIPGLTITSGNAIPGNSKGIRNNKNDIIMRKAFGLN